MVQDGFPLKNKTVAITRPRAQAQETACLIKQLGGKAYIIPTIEIAQTTDTADVQTFVTELENGNVDYVLFMSVNGITYLLDIAEKLGVKANLKEHLNNATVLAVGPKTAQKLAKHDINVDLIPENYDTNGITDCLQQQNISNKTIYIPRTKGAPPLLKNNLTKLDAKVKELYVYNSLLPQNPELNKLFIKDLQNKNVDAIIFGSSLSAKNLFTMLEELISKENLQSLLNNLTVVSIGPTTTKTLHKLGLHVDVMPKKYLFNDTLKELANHWTRV